MGMRVWISTIALCLLWCSASASCAAPQKKVGPIRRLDGTTISVAEADEFARTTLRNAHVTGAQIAVLDQTRLVWNAAFGLRRRDPQLLMGRETTMWAASITKSVFSTYVMQLVERGEFQLDVAGGEAACEAARPIRRLQGKGGGVGARSGMGRGDAKNVAVAQLGSEELRGDRAGQEAASALQARDAVPLFGGGDQPCAVCDRAAEGQATGSVDAGGAVYTAGDDAYGAYL